MRLVAVFTLSDTFHPEAHFVIEALATHNICVSILSGDHPAQVLSGDDALGIPVECVRVSCLPADKQALLKELSAEGETVLFCGDSTNDSLALAQVGIGVHLHTGDGAGVAASAAVDIVLKNPTLTGILTLLDLSDTIARPIAVNFVWSAVDNLVAILSAAWAFVHARVSLTYAGLGEVILVAVILVAVILVAVELKWFKASV